MSACKPCFKHTGPPCGQTGATALLGKLWPDASGSWQSPAPGEGNGADHALSPIRAAYVSSQLAGTESVLPCAPRANMDVLVSLGTNASYIYSLISILHHHFAQHHMSGDYRPTDFFETAAMLITFILLGKYLEASAKGKTSAAITQLLTLTPATALLLTVDKLGEVASEEEVHTSLIHRGDRIKVGTCTCTCRRSLPPHVSQSTKGACYGNEAMTVALCMLTWRPNSMRHGGS